APQDWFSIASHLDEIWTPSDFVTSSFENRLSIPVKTVPIPLYVPEHCDLEQRAENSVVKCLAMADGRSSFHRKNLISAARIFVRAFDTRSDAEMTIKLRNADEFPGFESELKSVIGGHDNVSIINQSISNSDRWRLISEHNVALSTHRAEGFGLHLAEAMALGKCAVATGWSGNTGFMTDSNSMLLPYSLEPVIDPYGIYQACDHMRWAKVDEDAGIEALRRLNKDRDLIQTVGARARQDVISSLSGDTLENAVAGLPS
ncbi:MAG: hypothetical protein AAF768_05815, partial [Pseudomonadota bacterium]